MVPDRIVWSGWLVVAISQVSTSTEAEAPFSLQQFLGLQLHGFVSQGAFKSTANDYLGESKRGSFAFSEAGVNFTAALTDELSAGIQFFARFLGTQGGFSAKFDWFYLDYHWSDWLGIRAGRVKLPFGLYNEFSDIDSARVPILLPQGVYPIANRDYLLAQTGAEIYGFAPIGAVGALAYRIYGGTILFDDLAATTSGPYRVDQLSTRYLFGGRLVWETPLSGLRLAGSVQTLRIDIEIATDPMLTPDGSGEIKAGVPVVLWIASAEYLDGDFLIAAEYSRWRTKTKTNQPTLFPDSNTEREQFYLMTDLRITDWLHPGAYYSVLFPNVESRSGRADVQHDVALTLRFDINTFWLVKLEGHFLSGTAALSSELNDGVPLNQLERHWGFFLLKTTVQF